MDDNKNNEAPPAAGNEGQDEVVINPFLAEDEAGSAPPAAGDDEGGDEEIVNTINKRIQPIQEKLQTTERKAELDNFFQTELGSHLKPYEAKIRGYAMDKRSRGLTVEAIAHAAAGKALINIGAKLAGEGKIKADSTSTAAKTKSPPQEGQSDTTVPDVTSMTRDEFTKYVEGVKSGRIKTK